MNNHELLMMVIVSSVIVVQRPQMHTQTETEANESTQYGTRWNEPQKPQPLLQQSFHIVIIVIVLLQ